MTRIVSSVHLHAPAIIAMATACYMGGNQATLENVVRSFRLKRSVAHELLSGHIPYTVVEGSIVEFTEPEELEHEA